MRSRRKQTPTRVGIRLEVEPFPISPAKIRSLVRGVLKRFGAQDAQVDLVVADDAEMRRMHERYFQNGRTTDVISFDLSEPHPPTRCFQILVNAALARREARRRGHSPQAELSLYIVHGLLHNLGFDDGNPAQAEQMHQMEDEVLKSFGYPPVYRSPQTRKKSRSCCGK